MYQFFHSCWIFSKSSRSGHHCGFVIFSEWGFFQDKKFAQKLTFSRGTAVTQAQEPCAIPSLGSGTSSRLHLAHLGLPYLWNFFLPLKYHLCLFALLLFQELMRHGKWNVFQMQCWGQDVWRELAMKARSVSKEGTLCTLHVLYCCKAVVLNQGWSCPYPQWMLAMTETFLVVKIGYVCLPSRGWRTGMLLNIL